MKRLRQFLSIPFCALSISISAQGINGITFLPAEPTTTDTILVISDFSYYGDCSYGLVYNYTYKADTAIHMLPTFCGYFLQDSVLCQSVDTFKIAPLSQGMYSLNLEYHQGSICPISDFDATLASYQVTFDVDGTNAVEEAPDDMSLIVYPNPVSGNLYIQTEILRFGSHVRVVDMLGRIVRDVVVDEPLEKVAMAGLHGSYFVTGVDDGKVLVTKLVVLE